MKRYLPVLAVVILWLALMSPDTLLAGQRQDGRFALLARDFRAYYTGAIMVANGVRGQLYDADVQFAWQQKFAPELRDPGKLLPYAAPPVMAVIQAPLAVVGFEPAYQVWTVINYGLLLVICWLILDTLRSRTVVQDLLTAAMLVTFLPVTVLLMQGQISLLLLLGLLLSWRSFARQRDLTGGLWLSLLILKPQLALLPAALLIWKVRWKALGGFLLGAVAMLAASLVVVGTDGIVSYGTVLTRASNWDAHTMVNWRGLLSQFMGESGPTEFLTLWMLGELLVCGVLFWGWRGGWEAGTAKFDMQWALLAMVVLFASPYAFFHEGSLLIVSGALIARSLTEAPLRWAKTFSWVLPSVGYVAGSTGAVGGLPWLFLVPLMLATIVLLSIALHRGQQRTWAPISSLRPE